MLSRCFRPVHASLDTFCRLFRTMRMRQFLKQRKRAMLMKDYMNMLPVVRVALRLLRQQQLMVLPTDKDGGCVLIAWRWTRQCVMTFCHPTCMLL